MNQTYTENQTYRDNVDNTKNIKNLNKCMELIKSNVKFPLASGKQGQAFKITSEECGSVVLKEYLNNRNSINEIKKVAMTEQRIMKFFTKIVEKNICPNFIKLLDYNSNVPFIVMEYADGDVSFMFKNDSLITAEPVIYDILMCQVLIGILCIHTQTLIYHRDIKPVNILYKHINKNIVFHYKINEKNYYIPTHGYLFMIADFGIAGTRIFEHSDTTYFGEQIIKCYSTFLSKEYKGHNDFINRLPHSGQSVVRKQKLDLPMSIDYSIKKNIFNNDTLILKKIREIHKMLNYSQSIMEILDKYFSHYTKNNFDEKYIVTFKMDMDTDI